MAGNEERPVIEAARPNLALMTQAIVKPDITGHFELKQYMVQLIQSIGQYVGLSHEDPQRHIQNLLEIIDTYNYLNVSKDYVRLTLFPFSLLGEAREWLQKEPANSIHNWDDLARNGESRRALKQKAAGVIEPYYLSAMRAEIVRLANQMDKKTMHHAQQMQYVQHMSTCCELCGEGHTSDICPVNPESIYYVGQQARGLMNQYAQYGNKYNPN
ncbi:PREDICTED: uncharacterized protein LOC109236771 [Nicotiana attenuata]|uniref:uncharacterized protein LOC109236771 n=1 Tax=Nicotiana attenuata TaxID=49451 RepID=UPI000904BD50|nr:PREDICTED: uncharacterized protein LOC109236771 [Nicotiana attenuata]